MRRGLLVVALGAVLACSEAKDPVDDATSATSGAGAAGAGGQPATTTTTTSAAGGSSGTALVINEVSSAGDDYVELFNPTAAPVSTDGLRVADDDAGMPKTSEAADISGMMVAPGGYVFVLAGLDVAALPGQQTACGPGPAPCFQAAFGISSTSGDVIYLIDENGVVLTSVAVPAIADGETYSRLPNGTGDFTAGAPTPGADNAAL